MTPAANSASGTRIARQPRNRHASTAPTGASSATGGRTVAPTNDTNEPGTCCDAAHAAEVVGELGGRVQRVQRVAGDDQVRERPQDGRGASTNA